MEKLLKDYPQKKWLEAADGCDQCGVKREIKVIWIDETGNFGEIFTRIRHSKDCSERYDIETGMDCGETLLHDVAGWTFKRKTIRLKGKTFTPLASKSNVGPCLNCGKLTIHPLILFIDKGRGGELDFCWSCAEELGILNHLK